MKEGRWAGRDDQEGLPDGAKLGLQEEEHTVSRSGGRLGGVLLKIAILSCYRKEN